MQNSLILNLENNTILSLQLYYNGINKIIAKKIFTRTKELQSYYLSW